MKKKPHIHTQENLDIGMDSIAEASPLNNSRIKSQLGFCTHLNIALIALSAIIFVLSMTFANQYSWCILGITSTALGLLGYIKDVLNLTFSKRIHFSLMLFFAVSAIWQIVDIKISEQSANKKLATALSAITSEQIDFMFRFPVHPDGKCHMSAVSEHSFRLINTSHGYFIFHMPYCMGGPTTNDKGVQSPGYVITTNTLTSFLMDDLELSILHWLVSPQGMQWEIIKKSNYSNKLPPILKENDRLGLSVFCYQFPNNKFAQFLLHDKNSVNFFHDCYPFNPNIESISSIPTNNPKSRKLLITAQSIVFEIQADYKGRTHLSAYESSFLGLPLRYNNYDLPYIATEDFHITLRRISRPNIMPNANDIEMLRALSNHLLRDFDWEVYQTTLRYTVNTRLHDIMKK
jgi:hypothetical protein